MSKIETLHCESELAHLGSRVVARQTLINPLIPQSDGLHLQHLSIL